MAVATQNITVGQSEFLNKVDQIGMVNALV
jgi:hypothetical protein